MNELTTNPVTVYVPSPDAPHTSTIDARSGVVGTPTGDRVLLDYEGNRYGATNLATWADRVNIAWSRHSQNYPTIARSFAPADAVTAVGTFDPRSGDVTIDPQHRGLVAAWLGVADDSLDEQLLTTSAKHQTRRKLLAMHADPARRREAELLARRMHIDL